jgi:hypothetical protein
MAGEVIADDVRLLQACDIIRQSRGGPGGQHANKTATGVRLRHRASGLQVQACEHRSGEANRAAALRRLRLALACSVRGGSDPAWLRPHVSGGRLACGAQAHSWPAVAAVLLDALQAAGGEVRAAASVCRLSTTQLIRALCSDQPVRAAADAIRDLASLPRLRP